MQYNYSTCERTSEDVGLSVDTAFPTVSKESEDTAAEEMSFSGSGAPSALPIPPPNQCDSCVRATVVHQAIPVYSGFNSVPYSYPESKPSPVHHNPSLCSTRLIATNSPLSVKKEENPPASRFFPLPGM